MEVRRIGSYVQVDEQGHLVNRSNIKANQPRWLAAVERVKDMYLATWPNDLHSIYVRGSIAKGLAVDNISDIDSFAVLKAGRSDSSAASDRGKLRTWADTAEETLTAEFPFVTGLEVDLEPLESLEDGSSLYAFVIKVSSACIYGDDLAARIAPFKVDHKIAIQARYIHRHFEQFLAEYPKETEAEKKLWLTWLMRRFLRLGMEFVMQDEQRFTRDLYLCHESFAKHYPEQAQRMYHALELAINPRTDDEVMAFVTSFGNWLIHEASRKLHHWGYVQNDERHWVNAA